MPDKLKDEWPGILAWMVQGCLDWNREGLTEPAAVMEATQEYREQEDLLAAFQGITQRTADHFEGVRALKEKRPPRFKGWDDPADRKRTPRLEAD